MAVSLDGYSAIGGLEQIGRVTELGCVFWLREGIGIWWRMSE